MPDAQVSLANERTFLSWVRTSLALVVTGVAIVAFDLPLSRGWQVASGLVFAVLGVAAAVQAWLGWRATDRAIHRGDDVPAPASSLILVIGVIVAIAVLGVGALLA
jgi:putative membrane protein